MILMPRTTKRIPAVIFALAGWILFMHYVDLVWLVMPNLHHGGYHPSWMDLTCLVGLGGVFLSLYARRLASGALVPVGDPRLPESLALKHAY